MKSRFNILFEQVMDVILESRRDDYAARLKSKNMDESIADELMVMDNPKKEKIALYWILKGTLKLPEDQDKLDQAFNLIEKQHLDFQQFEGPMFVINREDKSTQRINAQSQTFDPDKEPTFKDRKDLGNGVVVYTVDDTKEGQLAVRKAIDVNWGYDKNPWCLAARKGGFNPQEINALPEEQKERLGLNSKDQLATAWTYWNKKYNKYPKRIAFKDGKLLAFSAGDVKQLIEWWDKNDKSHTNPKELFGIEDDIEFLKKYGRMSLIKNNLYSIEDIKKFANDEESNVRIAIARKKGLSPELIEKLANDESSTVRYEIALRKDLSPELIEKLANDKNSSIRDEIAKRKNLSLELIEKLANDKAWAVRFDIAERKNLSPELIEKLANDENTSVRREIAKKENLSPELVEKLANDKAWTVRYDIVRNPNTTVEIIVKLAADEDRDVRKEVAANSSTPVEILRKLAEDETEDVRHEVGGNPNTPTEILRKLADDESAQVREEVARNPNTPVEILMKLAEDEDWHVKYGVAVNPNTPPEVFRKIKINNKI